MRVAVVGAGVSGLAAAHALAEAGGVDVVLYEKEDHLGGHAKTVTVDGVDVDLGFMVFNRVTYPNMMEFFEGLGVDMETSDMSFSVSLDGGRGYEWGSRNGLASLFAQKTNALNPSFWNMIREIIKFKDDVLKYLEDMEENPDMDRNETLGHFIKTHGYSELFQRAYLIPICGSMWSCPSEVVMSFSAFFILSFCRNHYLLQDLQTGRRIGLGRKQSNGAYLLVCDCIPHGLIVCMSNTDSPYIWHCRLGHPSLEKLRQALPWISITSFDCESF